MNEKLPARFRSFIVRILVLGLLPLAACNSDGVETETAPAARSFSVATETVESSEDAGALEYSGTVIGESSVPLTTKLMSTITQLELEVGQAVSAGQVLVRIDDSDIRAMRSEAAAYRAEAQAALGEVEAVRQQAQSGVAQAEAGIAQAEVALQDANRDLQRMQLLFSQDVVARSQLDKAQLGVDIAAKNLDQARAAKQQAVAAVNQAESRTPQVEAKEAQAGARDLQAAALQDYAVLRAPFDGIVRAKYFEQGQLSVPGQPIVVIERSSMLRVEASIPDSVAMGLKLGDSLQLAIDNGDQRELRSATVAVLGASADPASRSVPVELDVADDSGLFTGQFVRVLVPGGARSSLWVPEAAVFSEGEVEYVWRVSSGGLLTRSAVDSGQRMDGRVEILRGLSAGDRIVSEPVPGLYAGARIAGAEAAEGH